jgi:hypothetical protein
VATTREIYEQTIRPLPRQERRELADLILADLARPERPAGRRSMLELIETLPEGPRAFPTWDEYERHLQEERDAWDH